jgi:REP element-mobilizing transposase RayT
MERFRITADAMLYYLTFSVLDWLPVFIAEQPCLIITESLNFCHRVKGLRTVAFVIMPTHIHLIIADADFDVDRLRKTIVEMRRYTGQQLLRYCVERMPRAFYGAFAATRRTDRETQFWQQSRHAEAICSRSFFEVKLNYLHDNPRRKGLVCEPTQWRFSSAAHWLLTPPGPSDVILSAPEW